MSEFDINFHLTKEESAVMKKIVDRAEKLFPKRKRMDIYMDLTACHCNGTRLDLDKLLNADDFNLAHDVSGIAGHINRGTGKISAHFLPRCAMPKSA
jgi:predicted nucleic acid binding AN1-type Zn finger protein